MLFRIIGILVFCIPSLSFAQNYQAELCNFHDADVDSLYSGVGDLNISTTYSSSGSFWEVDWSEEVVFNRLISYTNPTNTDQSFELRLGNGGQVYSFKTSGFGEALPPQWRPSYDSSGTNTQDPGTSDPVKSHHGNWAPWVDEVWQFVGSDQRDVYQNKVVTRNIHQAGSYMNNFAHRPSDLTTSPFYSPLVQQHTNETTESFSFISWGQSENPAYIYDPFADCSVCVPDSFKALVLYFQRYKNLGNGVIQVDFQIYNFSPNRGIDYWTIPFVGIRNSSLPYAFISNDPNDGTSYEGLNTLPGHPVAGSESQYLPEYSQGATSKTSGNNSASSGWFAFSTTASGTGPSLAFVTSKSTANPTNGYGDIRYGTAMSNDKRDVTIFTRRANGGAADTQTGLKPWGIVGGECIQGRYFIVVDASIDQIVTQIQTRGLTANAKIEKVDLQEDLNEVLHYQFLQDAQGTITPSLTEQADAQQSLNAKAFTGSYPVFMITTSNESVLSSNPYLYALKPYDGSVESIELLGFSSTYFEKETINPLITGNAEIEVTFKVFPNPAQESITIAGNQSNVDFKLIDATGRTLFIGNIQDQNQTINLSNFESGIYYLQIGKQTVKFVKR